MAVFKLNYQNLFFIGLPRPVELKRVLLILKKELPDIKMGWVSKIVNGNPSLQSLWNNVSPCVFGNLNVIILEGQRLDKVAS